MANPLRSRKRGNTIVWILMALLVLGLGGYGARNLGGTIRSIGAVGEREIDLRDYARALNAEQRALSAATGQPVSFAQLQAAGIDTRVQARVIATAALENAADGFGISVGDGEVRDRIVGLDAFKGLDGQFSRDAYTLRLRQEGLSEAEFETKLRDESARSLLQGAVLGATAANPALAETLAAWALEQRSFTLAELTAADLAAPVPEPDEAAIAAYHAAHPEKFTRPETRRITYVWLSPEMLTGEVTLDEAALRELYQSRISEFVQPERRLVERLVYPDEAAAEAAMARYRAGEATFADLAAERGLTLDDIDLGEVTEADLGAAGAAVFALAEPGVVGPLPSDLGPALYSVNAILEARETSFEQARDELAAEAELDQARRLVAERSERIEDVLASGASLEDVAAETGMELGTIAVDAGTDEGIAAFAEFRKAALEVTAEDFPTLHPLSDGGVFALRLDGIDPPALKPLAEVRDEVIAAWRAEETHKRLMALAGQVQARLAAGEALESTGLVVTRYDDFPRQGHLGGAPAQTVDRVFALKAPGDSAIVEDGDRVVLVALRAIHPADPEAPDSRDLVAAIAEQTAGSLANDMLSYYVQAIEDEAGIRLDPQAINAVHAQMN
ncbi:peptidylprolyl isomerase [Albidovulum sp.]